MRTVVLTSGLSWRRAGAAVLRLAPLRRGRARPGGGGDARERGTRVVVTEDRGAGDEQRRACLRAGPGGLLVDAAVDLELDLVGQQRAQPAQLAERRRDERLPA